MVAVGRRLDVGNMDVVASIDARADAPKQRDSYQLRAPKTEVSN
jgi:hypothetical protein